MAEMDGLQPRTFAAATFGDQDAGSGPVHSSPNIGPMTAALHNISARHLHDIGTNVPDDRQFLRSWRRQLQEALNQHHSKTIQFLMAAPPSASASASDSSDASSGTNSDPIDPEIVRRCTAVLTKYAKPTWNFASSTRDIVLPSTLDDTAADIEKEIGVNPTVLREQLRKIIRLYANAANAMCTAEMRLEDKLKRLETVVERVNDLMFLEPTAELEKMAEVTRPYLDSVLDKITFEAEYKEIIEQYKRFVLLKSLISLGSFNKATPPACTICMTKEVSQAVIPCGHTFCEDCCRTQLTSCYICRVQIRDKVRLYFS
jgi:hypothetical protein